MCGLSAVPFQSWRPAADDRQARWVLDALVRPMPVTVGFRVPLGHEAVLRIMHRPHAGGRWAERYPDEVLRAGSSFPPEPYDLLGDLEGEFPDADVDRLADELHAVTGDDRVTARCGKGGGG